VCLREGIGACRPLDHPGQHQRLVCRLHDDWHRQDVEGLLIGALV
jgi:hypothetical protein